MGPQVGPWKTTRLPAQLKQSPDERLDAKAVVRDDGLGLLVIVQRDSSGPGLARRSPSSESSGPGYSPEDARRVHDRALKRHLARHFHRLLSEPAVYQRAAVDPISNGVAPSPMVCIT